MGFSEYQRLVIAYHGCDRKIATSVAAGARLEPSFNDYDWLGNGIYFWEHGPARALEWAELMPARKDSKVKTPAVVGALIQLGNCFDLLDVRFTGYLKQLYPAFCARVKREGSDLPKNEGLFHYLDCAFLNWAIPSVEAGLGLKFQTIRGVFIEGNPAYPRAEIFEDSHIQIAVRDHAAIIGYFSPSPLDADTLFTD